MTAADKTPALPAGEDGAWSIKQTALYLGISAAMVRKLEDQGVLLPLPRIGRRVIYDPRDVRAFRAGKANVVPLGQSSGRR
jgi:hypothetical protein